MRTRDGAWRWRPRLGVDELPAAIAALAAAASPFWQTYPAAGPSGLTVGRGLLLLLAVTLLPALWQRRPDLVLPAVPALESLAAFGLLTGLVVVSSYTNGCTCAGGTLGFLEFGAALVGVAGAVALAPAWAPRVLGAIVAGAALLAVLALAGVHDLHTSSTPVLRQGGDRLSGPLANPNLLALHLAFAAPVLVVAARRVRGAKPLAVLLVAGLAIAVAIVLTYSRSGLLAAAGGALTAAVVGAQRTSSRRGAAMLAAGTAVGVAAGVTLLFVGPFADARRTLDTRAQAQPGTVDRNGWASVAVGPMRQGPAVMTNPVPGVLAVTTTRRSEGMSLNLPPSAKTRDRYTVAFVARTTVPRLEFAYAIEDVSVRGGAVSRRGVLTRRPRTFVIHWDTGEKTRAPRFYVWLPVRPGVIEVESALVTAPVVRRASLELAGSPAPAPDGRAIESRYLDSRREVARTALRVIADHPLFGVGWQRFPVEAARRLPGAGIAATHNEPLRFAAELGLPGLVLLLAWGAATLLAAFRLPPGPVRAGLAGVFAAGAVGLQFANSLSQPAVTIHLAIACGAIVGLSAVTRPADRGRGPRHRASADPA